jgi:HEAT repeat protein
MFSVQEAAMSASRPALALALFTAFAADAGEPPPRIKAADFPSVSRRAVFFEDRINAADATVRRRVLTEVTCFFNLPDPEYVAFLRRLLRDPDPVVRGGALRQLHAMWVSVAVADLPRTFAGFHDGQIIDRDDAKTVPGLIQACRARSPEAGYAAYVLGLLRHKPAAAALRQLAQHENIFVRYAGARALLDIGDKEGARPVLEEISRSQLDLYAAGPAAARQPNPDGRQPYYAAVSCRALLELDGKDRKLGLERLIALAGHLERSADVNDQANLPTVRQLLAAVTGRYFLSEAAARKWYAEKFDK